MFPVAGQKRNFGWDGQAGVCKAGGAGSGDRSPEIRTRGFSSKSWPKDRASGSFFSVRLQLPLGNVKGT